MRHHHAGQLQLELQFLDQVAQQLRHQRIDLDPQPGTTFRDAIPAAHELRKVLEEASLTP
ncbi:MAG: non-homologous end-joining DNA ligase LigD, partial [Terriglobales bacterium]